eukprot:GFUD01010541.1.p1 GENE.GFUD01010541.1~~GFUD01010541.1.p1  ORF type:complete len:290 (-),score=41.07 GFUD01010541.1:68-886(-)
MSENMDTSATSSTGFASISPEVAYYKMNHSQRGKAVIFNQMTFANPKLATRNGSDHDAENLKKTLGVLGFDVATHKDLKLDEIEVVLKRLALEDHSKNDCLFVAILTHGEEAQLHAEDAAFSTDSLWTGFSAENCKSLWGKPKLFLIQACRGSDFNKPITKAATFTNVLTNIELPSHGSDILLIYGTIPGFVSLRDPATGSFLVQAFCRAMEDHMFCEDLLSIITEVCRVVAEKDEYMGNVVVDNQTGQRVEIKQMICFTSMLMRKIQFNKK